MGAAVSSPDKAENEERSISQSSKPGLGDIPESCISSLLMNLDPPDICKLARVNRAFHRASSADFVWESKLPPSYKFLADKVLGEENIATMTKKEIYAKLTLPNRFDGGAKVSCFMLWIHIPSSLVTILILSLSLSFSFNSS